MYYVCALTPHNECDHYGLKKIYIVSSKFLSYTKLVTMEIAGLSASQISIHSSSLKIVQVVQDRAGGKR